MKFVIISAILFIALVCLWVACDFTVHETPHPYNGELREMIAHTRYVKDSETGLCYALTPLGGIGTTSNQARFSLTWVPCNGVADQAGQPEVIK